MISKANLQDRKDFYENSTQILWLGQVAVHGATIPLIALEDLVRTLTSSLKAHSKASFKASFNASLKASLKAYV